MWGRVHASDMPVRRSDYAVLQNLDDPPTSPKKSFPHGVTLLRRDAPRRDKDDPPDDELGESRAPAAFLGSPRKSTAVGPGEGGDEDFLQPLPVLQPARAAAGALGGPAGRRGAAAQAQDKYALSDFTSVKGGLSWVSVTSNAGGHIFRDERDGGGPFSEPLRRDHFGSVSSAESPMSLPAAVGLTTDASSDSSFLESIYAGAAADDIVSLQAQHRKFPTWAQQTEQTYSLQLALALRMVAEAELTDEPGFLGTPGGPPSTSPRAGVDATAHRLWVGSVVRPVWRGKGLEGKRNG